MTNQINLNVLMTKKFPEFSHEIFLLETVLIQDRHFQAILNFPILLFGSKFAWQRTS